MPRGRRIVFTEEQLSGSRPRCLMMTMGSREQVAARLTELCSPCGFVNASDSWLPKGFVEKTEVQLGKTKGFLTDEQRNEVVHWWLEHTRGRQTPKWDLVSSCTIGGLKGLLLVEAKAHFAELKDEDRCKSEDPDNQKHIRKAILEARDAVGWNLTPDSYYQLSNRLAWSWKLASMGIPVVLVYLGFLNADEMRDPFPSHQAWENAVVHYAKQVVPDSAWEQEGIRTSGEWFHALIKSIDIGYQVK
jgi:hypothetical protein